MLKNKKAIYVLIPVNILVWGFFVYRIFSAMQDSDLPHISENNLPIKLKINSDSNVYHLSLSYKDPFLKDAPKNIVTHNPGNLFPQNPKPKTEKKIVAPTPAVQPKVLPEIKYLGLIKNSTSGAATALVTINGQSKLIKVNEVVEGITVKSFDNQELVALAGKEKIVVKKL